MTTPRTHVIDSQGLAEPIKYQSWIQLLSYTNEVINQGWTLGLVHLKYKRFRAYTNKAKHLGFVQIESNALDRPLVLVLS